VAGNSGFASLAASSPFRFGGLDSFSVVEVLGII
jgi:hypothetical protein